MICENASGPSTHIRRSTQCMGERRTQPGRLWDLWAPLQHLRTEWRDSDGARDSMALKLRKSEYFGTWRGMECMVVASSLPPQVFPPYSLRESQYQYTPRSGIRKSFLYSVLSGLAARAILFPVKLLRKLLLRLCQY